MKETLSYIEYIIEEKFNSNNPSYINESKYDLFNCVDHFFIEKKGNVFFVTVLIDKILVPISNLINNNRLSKPSLIPKVYNLEKSHKKREILIEIHNKLICQYKHLIKDSEYYQNILLDNIKRMNFIVDYEFTSSADYKEDTIKKSIQEIIEYYDFLFQIDEFQTYKQDLYSFTEQLKSKIKKIKYDLTHKYIDTPTTIEKKELIETKRAREWTLNHMLTLERLLNKLSENYLTLKKLNNNDEISLTVFGDKNFDKVEELYEELSELIKIEPSKKEFVKKFFNDVDSSIKICFSKHNNYHISFTQSDYGYLISFLQKYFIEKYRNNSTLYNSWWANNFKFHNIEKDYIAIGKMRSNAAKDPSRFPKYKNQIDLLRRIFD